MADTRTVRIKRVGKGNIPNTGTFSNGRNTAIFTVLSTDLLGRGRDGSPGGGGCTLRDRLVDKVRGTHPLHVIQQGLDTPSSAYRPSSVAIEPGINAQARTPRCLWRRSNSTANSTLAVLARP